MPKRRTLLLSDQQRRDLCHARDHHDKAYMRERAAALIKISDGDAPHAVAQQGLLKRRKADTVYDWLNRFEQDGIDGLLIRDGRGKKPAFFP